MSYITYKLKDLLTVKHGYPFKSEFFLQSGPYIVMTPGNFLERGGFKLTPDKERYYNAEFPAEYLLHKGDLVVAMTEQTRGLLGSTVIIPRDQFLLHNQRIGLVTCDETRISKIYLYYLFNTSYVRDQIESSASGTKIKHTSPEKIGEVIVHIPESVDEQERIASTLLAIDTKIDLNTRLCAELESIARTLYDYWFVQFDFPDEHGMPYHTSGGEMVWCAELGEKVPKDWKVGTLSDLVSIQKEGFDPTIYGNETVEHYSIPAFDERRYPPFEAADTILSGKYTVPLGSILFSKLNPQFKRIWDPPCLSNVRACSTEFMVYTPIEEALRPFVYATLNSDAFYRFTVQIASSSTGSRKRLDPDATMRYTVIMPETHVCQQFCDQVKPTLEQVKRLQIEKHELTKLRDWLLPMLMNGQAMVEG